MSNSMNEPKTLNMQRAWQNPSSRKAESEILSMDDFTKEKSQKSVQKITFERFKIDRRKASSRLVNGDLLTGNNARELANLSEQLSIDR